MTAAATDDRGPLPVRVAVRAASRLIDPHGGPGERRLRDAVEGRVVLVTGASYGIGEETARKLAAAGATTLLVARSEERLEELAGEIAARGGTAHAHPCDLTDPDAVDRLAADVLDRHGHLDVLVSNAGKSIRRSLELSYDRFQDFQKTIDINYLGPVKLVMAFLPAMRERGAGHVVNVSTVGVRVPPMPRWAAYQASKAAFDVFVRSAAIEARGDGIDFTSVYMALVRTRMAEPTPAFRYVPGLEPDEAADLVCRAVVDRPRTIEPWWVPFAEVVSDVAGRPVDAAASVYHRMSDDSDAAKRSAGEAAPPPRRGGSLPGRALGALRAPLSYARLGAGVVAGAARSGVLDPVRPDRLVRMVASLRLGVGLATAAAAAAARHPDHPGLIDERGALTFAELDHRGGALAAGLRDELGVEPGRPLALMCRNHRGFVETALAASRLGADLLLLNTEFAAPQLAQVLERDRPAAVVLDEEFAECFDAAGYDGPRAIAWHERAPAAAATLDELIERDGSPPSAAAGPGRMILLTSGTTGPPKGAPRSPSLGALIGPGATLFSVLPIRAREPLLVAPPLFHGFGLAYLGLALALPCTLVLRRRFDPEAALAAVEEHRVTGMAAVPVMLERIMQLPEDVRRGYDTSSLKAVFAAASPLSAELAAAFMDEFGDVLHDLYGSTETGFGAVATPDDLRAAPGTVGRPPLGTTLKILRDDGGEAEPGETGRICIGGPLVFEGYSGGGEKETVGGLMSTGDLGHLDDEGRLFIDGREDDMIVSGGENVFPQEVEEVLARHGSVADVAVVGVEDEDFGQRLRAFVVRDGEVGEDELRSYVKSELARYKVPRDVVFVDEVPRNATGKVLKRELRELAASER